MKYLNIINPVWWLNEYLILRINGSVAADMLAYRTFWGKYFPQKRWARLHDGGHWEKWLMLGNFGGYKWVRVAECYHTSGIRPSYFAHLTTVCEDYPAQTQTKHFLARQALDRVGKYLYNVFS
jgi:hypothetical protein